MRGHCRKNCNFDYLNRLAFRIFSQRFNFKRKRFVLVHNLHDEIFFPVIHYFNSDVLHLLHKTPPKLDVSAHKPKHETISLMDHKPRQIVNDLRPISHITQKTLSFLHSTKIEQITKTMVIFKTSATFLCFIRCDPMLPQTSVQRLAHTRNVTTCCFCSHLLQKFRYEALRYN